MTFKVKRRTQYISKERQSREIAKFVEKTGRETKENYLGKVGIFKESEIRKMDDTQLNELVVSALQVKGFY